MTTSTARRLTGRISYADAIKGTTPSAVLVDEVKEWLSDEPSGFWKMHDPDGNTIYYLDPGRD